MYQEKDQLAEETALKILQILSDGKLTYSDWDNVKIKVNVYLDNSIVISFPDAKSEVEEIKEVKRPAEVGEYVKIVNDYCSFGNFHNGEIHRCVSRYKDFGIKVNITGNVHICHSEYVVLENYTPPDDKPCN